MFLPFASAPPACICGCFLCYLCSDYKILGFYHLFAWQGLPLHLQLPKLHSAPLIPLVRNSIIVIPLEVGLLQYFVFKMYCLVIYLEWEQEESVMW